MSTKKNLTYIIVLALCVFIVSCQPQPSRVIPSPVSTQHRTSTPVPTEEIELADVENVSPTTDSHITVQTVSSDTEITSFGWLPDGNIYYTTKEDEEIKWHKYHPVTGAIEIIDSPNPARDFLYHKPLAQIIREIPGINPLLYDSITEQESVDVVTVSLSPSNQAAVYTRLPIGYKRPTPEPHYIDPLELWIALEGGEKKALIEKDFSYECGGIFYPEGDWLFNETAMIGSCGDTNLHFFYVDLLSKEMYFFGSNMEFELAHESLSMAISSIRGLLFVPLVEGERIPAPIDDYYYFLVEGGNVGAPRWSSDDQWIYYWRLLEEVSSKDQQEDKQTTWRLERVNISSKEVEIVLNQDELRTIMGSQHYELFVKLGYTRIKWELSPDNNQALIYMDATSVSHNKLLLVSW